MLSIKTDLNELLKSTQAETPMARKFVTFNVLFSFVILFLTSLVLYVIPGAGTVGPWSFWGLNRGQWIDLHLISGLLMLAFCLWHLLINWKSLRAALKKTRSFRLKSAWPLWAALALNLFIVFGTLNQVAPLNQVLITYREFKQEMRRNAAPLQAESPQLEQTAGLSPASEAQSDGLSARAVNY